MSSQLLRFLVKTGAMFLQRHVVLLKFWAELNRPVKSTSFPGSSLYLEKVLTSVAAQHSPP